MDTQKPSKSQGIRLLQQLYSSSKRIFNIEDAAVAATEVMIPRNQLDKILSNLAKQGRVLRLRRGLYVCVGLLPEQAIIHPFIISAHLIEPSAISHWSALQHHGLTEQIPQIVTASTPNKVVTPSMREKTSKRSKTKHSWEIGGVRYEYINVQEKHYYGTEKIWLDEHYQVSITDKERTLLDVFIYSKMFGGMGEALGILENSLASLDLPKLVAYAVKYDKKSLAKRLGWALKYFGIADKLIEPLLKIPVQDYCPLDPSAPAIGPCDKKWMIQNNLTKVNSR